MNNYTLTTAGLDTHLRVVTVSLTLAITIVWFSMLVS